MRTIIVGYILLFQLIVTPAVGEIVKLKCEKVEQNELEKKANFIINVEFDTSKKTVQVGEWRRVKVMQWTNDRIVWSNINHGIATIAVYDMATNLLQIKMIDKFDFDPTMYRLKFDNRPNLCRRSTF